MFHKKFGPDRFSRFDVYWIQTDIQTNKTDKPNLYIDSPKSLTFSDIKDVLIVSTRTRGYQNTQTFAPK